MVVFVLLLFFIFTETISPTTLPDRFTKSHSPSLAKHKHHQEYFEISLPLPSDPLTPACTLQIVRHSFADTINGPPFTTRYSPPSNCSLPWSRVVLEFRAKCRGEQYDRISGLWLAGVELLRTSTAEPTEKGIFWKVRKDITRYYSLLLQSDLDLTIMLENVVNSEYTGVYHVEVDFIYYQNVFVDGNDVVLPPSIVGNQSSDRKFDGSYLGGVAETPADLILPISDSGERGFWYKIESEMDMRFKEIRIPKNTRRAVLEIYVSFHGNDEFWYSNPPNPYVIVNSINTGRGNGAYREVIVTVDGELAGSEIPFPVVFTGGINPLFWGPVVAIGAFDLPTYDLELTPFLGTLLDGKAHQIGIGVAEGISYWLVNANLHLWLDHNSKAVEAKSNVNRNPVFRIEKGSVFRKLDGSFSTKAQRTSHSVGWVSWSAGNFTTTFKQSYKFINSIRFQKNGTHKLVKQKVLAKKEVKFQGQAGQVIVKRTVDRRYPLDMITATLPCSRKNTYMLVTNLSHSMQEKYSYGGGKIRLFNSQNSNGWMEVRDHSVLSGEAKTNQNFWYKNGHDCYCRNVAAGNGRLLSDNVTNHCLTLFTM